MNSNATNLNLCLFVNSIMVVDCSLFFDIFAHKMADHGTVASIQCSVNAFFSITQIEKLCVSKIF
jgi:hypothetical protein